MIGELQGGRWITPLDSDGQECRILNHYECVECEVAWSDWWSCACNDCCPVCDVEVEPYESIEVAADGNLAPASSR